MLMLLAAARRGRCRLEKGANQFPYQLTLSEGRKQVAEGTGREMNRLVRAEMRHNPSAGRPSAPRLAFTTVLIDAREPAFRGTTILTPPDQRLFPVWRRPTSIFGPRRKQCNPNAPVFANGERSRPASASFAAISRNRGTVADGPARRGEELINPFSSRALGFL